MRGPSNPTVICAILYLVALVIRVVVGMAIDMDQPLHGDEREYYVPAVAMVDGYGYCMVPQQSADHELRPTAYRVPGPALVLAGVFEFIHPSVERARWVSAVVASTIAPLIYLFALSFQLNGVAIICGCIAAVYPTAVFYSLGLYSEPYFVACLLLSFLLTMRAIKDVPKRSNFLIAGLAWGVATLVRPHGLPIASLTLLYIGWRSDWRNAILFALGCGMLLVPWIARNYLALGHPILLATEGGETLLGANNAVVLEDSELHGMWLSPLAIAEYRDRLLPIQDEVARDRAQSKMAKEFLLGHPKEIPRLAFYKLVRWLTPVTKSGGAIRIVILTSYGTLLVLLFAGLFVGAYQNNVALHLAIMATLVFFGLTIVYWGGLTLGRLTLETIWIPWGVATTVILFHRACNRPIGRNLTPI